MPQKLPVALTEEEVSRAVKGMLLPRTKKQPYAGKPTRTKDKFKRQSGRPLGKVTGLPIFGAWCLAFQRNAKAHKVDDTISSWMKSEFPGRATKDFDHVHIARLMYNRGRFTRGKKPQVKSERYDANGDVIHGRIRKAPTPKKVKQIAALKTYGAGPKTLKKLGKAGKPKTQAREKSKTKIG